MQVDIAAWKPGRGWGAHPWVTGRSSLATIEIQKDQLEIKSASSSAITRAGKVDIPVLLELAELLSEVGSQFNRAGPLLRNAGIQRAERRGVDLHRMRAF